MNTGPIRVIVACDQMALRRGLATILLAFEDVLLIGEAQNGAETLQLCDSTQPDVVIVGMVLADMDGEMMTRTIRERYPQTQVIVLTHWEELGLVQRSLAAGASGVFLTNMGSEELVDIIRRVHSKPPRLKWRSVQDLMRLGRVPTLVKNPLEDLTNRELKVLALMSKGMTNSEIGSIIFISRATVKVHVSSILSKLGVTSRTEAVGLAIQLHILPVEEEESDQHKGNQ